MTTLATDIDIETRLLAAMLMDMCAGPAVARLVEPGDFAVTPNRLVFEAMVRLGEQDVPVTFEALATELGDKLDAAGGLSHLADYALAAEGVGLSMYYAAKVRDQAVERLRVQGVTRAAQLPQAESFAALTQIRADVERRTQPAVEWHNQDALWSNNFDRITGPADKDDAAISTGIPELDLRLGGLGRGDLIVFGAHSGVGKTSLATCIAWHVAFRKHLPVVFFSLEMTSEQIVNKFLSLETGIPYNHLKSHSLTDDETHRVATATGVASEAPLVIVTSGDDNPVVNGQLTVEAMGKTARDIAASKGKLGLVIVDHLHLAATAQKTDNQTTMLTAITGVLRQLALELRAPVIALSQLSDEGKLRDSRMIRANAVVVLMLEEDAENAGMVKCRLDKHRFAEKCSFQLGFHGPTQQFRSLTYTHSRDVDIQGVPRRAA